MTERKAMTPREYIVVPIFCTFIALIVVVAVVNAVEAVRSGYERQWAHDALVRCLTDGGGC